MVVVGSSVVAGSSVVVVGSSVVVVGSSVVVGSVDDEFVINPTKEQRERSQMAVTVASTDSRIAMIEAGANIIPDDVCQRLKVDEWAFINDLVGNEGSLTRAIFLQTKSFSAPKFAFTTNTLKKKLPTRLSALEKRTSTKIKSSFPAPWRKD